MTATDTTHGHGPRQRLGRSLVDRPAPDAAVELLGCLLVRERSTGPPSVARIVEVEAYAPDDPASHSAAGRTRRNASMFAAPGTAYVYRSYGVHWCCNVSVDRQGVGAAVLLRAATVVEGAVDVRARRGAVGNGRPLLQGPGNLTQGLDIDGDRHDGIDLLAAGSPLRLAIDELRPTAAQIGNGPRVGVTRAPEVAWRWWWLGEAAVSRYRRSPRAARR